MADVEMKDAAPGASGKSKAVTKGKSAIGEGKGDSKKRFEVKKWNAVALWAWDIVVDNCAICRNHIMDLSRIPFPLHFEMAENQTSVPTG
ncbi:RING-box protein 1A [Paracoccidioides brasiliensis Pb03]|nr:RING-box protein 1A [Paracoccidioides brasiliensis Pb03]